MAEKIKIQATVAKTPAQAWACYTGPEHITQWNFASSDWCCPHATNDLRAGGKYSARMEAKDKSFGFDFEAIYDEVHEPKLLAYTMPDGRKVTTEFAAESAGTRVTTIFDAEAQNPVEMQREGWQAILNNFKNYAESR